MTQFCCYSNALLITSGIAGEKWSIGVNAVVATLFCFFFSFFRNTTAVRQVNSTVVYRSFNKNVTLSPSWAFTDVLWHNRVKWGLINRHWLLLVSSGVAPPAGHSREYSPWGTFTLVSLSVPGDYVHFILYSLDAWYYWVKSKLVVHHPPPPLMHCLSVYSW